MKQNFGPAAGALACGLFLVFGCGGSSFEGSDGGGGSASAGTAGTASGGESSAGTSSAGKTSGGSSNGGSSDAGSSSGGSANAGTGGTATAGSATGGSSSGGAGGGATMSCEQDTDCMLCAYPTAPQTTGECYCASCATTPMSKASCMANQAQYAKVCGNVHLPCPAIACVLPPEPVCRSHMCVAK